MPELVENRYRDYLAEHLDLVEDGLTLVDAEMMLPNSAGAKGFVDLVARDKFGVLVLIELKRSDSAARSAMHELFKYVALVRENHGLAKHDIRCVLVSTTWRELLVPFSELLEAAAFELSGRHLHIGSDGQPVGTQLVRPVAAQSAISLCPNHEILLYQDAHKRSVDIDRIVDALAKEGVADYFLLLLDHDGTDSRVISPYALYIVLAELSLDQRSRLQDEQIAGWRVEYLAEEGTLDDWTIDESDYMVSSNWDHEEEIFVRVNRTCAPTEMEIGSPDKLRTLLESWRLLSITRSGRFNSKLIWSDDRLLSGALARGEKYSTLFVSQVATSNGAACNRMLENIEYPLLGAKGWAKQVPKLLRLLISSSTVESIAVYLYSPCDVLFGISALGAGKVDALPALEIIVESSEFGIRRFIGSLAWDPEVILDDSIDIERSVPGGAFWYHLTRHTGEQWCDEAAYCKFHGLRYAIYEVAQSSDPGADACLHWRVRVKKSALVREKISRGEMQNESMLAFARANKLYLNHLADELIRKHSIGFGI